MQLGDFVNRLPTRIIGWLTVDVLIAADLAMVYSIITGVGRPHAVPEHLAAVASRQAPRDSAHTSRTIVHTTGGKRGRVVTQPVGKTSESPPRGGDDHAVVTSTMRRWWRIARTQRWASSDPGRMSLRRAARAAVVMPAAFAFARFVIRDVQVTTFVAFGCFALLVMADFGGLRRPRAAAYMTATAVGAALIGLGTLASFSPWVAALGMLLIGFAVQFAGVFGGYIAAAQTALLLAFVLAASVPAPPAAVVPRLAGWFIAGVVSTLAGIFLWPRFERVAWRHQAAPACHALATLVREERARPDSADIARSRQAAERTVAAARRAYDATPKRPAGPAQRDRAFVALLSELYRILEIASRRTAWRLSAHHPCLIEGDRLAAAVAQTLEASGDVLIGGESPNLPGLQAARLAHREALDRWAAEALHTGSPAEDVLAGLETDDALRVVSYLTLALGADATIAAGLQLDVALRLPVGIPRDAGALGALRRIGRTIRTHLNPTSSVLHNSLRIAVGLALAVLLGGILRLQHAFWIVLGTLSALRSDALATGRSTVQALGGTAIGIVIGAPFIWAVGTATNVLWIILPIAVFLAAYAASALGFVAGQAAFTFVVIILFNLIAPAGWKVGLVRGEDIAIGVGISLVVGLLLWPRGLRGELRGALAELYRAVADNLSIAFDQILGREVAPEAFGRARSAASQARDRAAEAFDQYLRERGASPLDPETAGSLLAAGSDAILAADLIHDVADRGYRTRGQSDADIALQAQVPTLVRIYTSLADQLDRGAIEPANGVGVDREALRAVALAYLRRWKDNPAEGRAALAGVTACEWIKGEAGLAANLEQAVANVVEAARVPWWR